LQEYAVRGILRTVVSSAAWIALADPRRRAALELLLDRPRSVNELAGRLQLSQPSTSKHLKVLREAGLVTVRQDAQRRLYAIAPQPLAELHEWLARYRRLWDTSLDALERRLDETTKEER
jgi:DNA-binding transcriptional ArsR family regulator